ncbi:hypothetical protein Oweho_2141 [Owenweeksia hongkongensis DSM 17368]|uniref:DUF3885 domain-containing protein n=1 Tax=Owenweeksia hongkongensis (strain DSM 17368 / CIP 108786 / JCM 12287 / NRRL B-23963 / UST20020801) TaxID=926562 RepID=G8R448_OWEHD|nr:DUF3885 domain-containing protein [Owenweeksia hongkongensis]AEV33115.1 hypothetical protein Oweho_2141 [Owenweeksia hongkongensis DSM 17368]
MKNFRSEFQAYLDRVNSYSKIVTPHSIFGDIHIRFELGGDTRFKIIRNGVEVEWWNDRRRMTKIDKVNYKNHIKERVSQATFRATTLFNETFNDPESEIWVLIYEYEEGLFNNGNNFLLNLFSPNLLNRFYDNTEQVETQMMTEHQDGSFTFDKVEARIVIGKVKVKDIKTEEILNGIANNEMGLEPSISQTVYFLDPSTNRGFYMYDDRGCYVWSDTPDKITPLYHKRNEWIVNYHRPEIDKYFNKY